MDFGTISYTTIATLSFNIIKRLYLAWKSRKQSKLLIIPTDDVKKLIINFLEKNSDYLIVDIDNVISYLEFDEKEDITKFMSNRVLFRRLIKKFQQYIISQYSDEKILYITSKTENLDLFKNKIVFMPSKIYDTIKNTETDLIYELRTTGIKKVIFSSDNDILKEVGNRFI